MDWGELWDTVQSGYEAVAETVSDFVDTAGSYITTGAETVSGFINDLVDDYQYEALSGANAVSDDVTAISQDFYSESLDSFRETERSVLYDLSDNREALLDDLVLMGDYASDIVRDKAVTAGFAATLNAPPPRNSVSPPPNGGGGIDPPDPDPGDPPEEPPEPGQPSFPPGFAGEIAKAFYEALKPLIDTIGFRLERFISNAFNLTQMGK